MKYVLLAAFVLLSACSASPDAAPPASTSGMQSESPTGASGISTGTSNVINGRR